MFVHMFLLIFGWFRVGGGIWRNYSPTAQPGLAVAFNEYPGVPARCRALMASQAERAALENQTIEPGLAGLTVCALGSGGAARGQHGPYEQRKKGRPQCDQPFIGPLVQAHTPFTRLSHASEVLTEAYFDRVFIVTIMPHQRFPTQSNAAIMSHCLGQPQSDAPVVGAL